MGDHERFLATLAYLLVAVFAFTATVTPPDPFTQVYVAGPLGVLAVVASAWLVYFDGWERSSLAVPDPAAYVLELFAALIAGRILASLVPRRSVDLVGLSSSTTAIVWGTTFLLALAWLYGLGGHQRLVGVVARTRGEANA